MKMSQKISNHLMLKSVDLCDIGLYHGKMGLVLALYLYSLQESLEYIGEFAWELLQDVYAGVNEALPVGMEYGLSGIGYGVSLLKKYGVFDNDLDDVLHSIDEKIMVYDPRRIKDYSYRSGALGVYSYIRLRMDIEGKANSLDSQYLKELQQTLTKAPNFSNGIPYKMLWQDLQVPEWNTEEFQGKPIGIDGGLAYYLINTLDLK